jgi:hypothetical protein
MAVNCIDPDRRALLMDGIECEWCKARNEPDRMACMACGAPLDVKNRVSIAGFYPERVSRAIALALAHSGGVALVVNAFSGLPGVVRTPARRGLFESHPERNQIGDWRYEVAEDGRLRAAHLVSGVVIAEETLSADAVGPHIARSLEQIVARYGTTIVPNIDEAIEVLNTRAGHG